jgi:peptidoglycan/xylan/chitin deacetylase (PgdA/CDA1 family)
MFHHFHDEIHPVGQGSMSSQDFDDILQYIGIENIVSAEKWGEHYRQGRDIGEKVCITFDDSLLCQYDIAKPVLDKYNIKAFFFVYSSVLEGNAEYLEVFRYFRSKYFRDFDHFFESFLQEALRGPLANQVSESLRTFKPSEYLKDFSFYTDNDRTFRYLRDHILKVEMYNQTLLRMMKTHGVEMSKMRDLLWMTEAQVKTLSDEGHVLGLHSHTHPTTLGLLPKEEQYREYSLNKEFLEKRMGKRILCMSHPCNSYSPDTLDVLKDLGIEFGFRANMQSGFTSKYEIPREDHVILHKALKRGS